MAVKLGILGGTFDPIHYGHLIAAQEVLWALGLEQVLFVPAGVPPHKPGAIVSPAHHRVAMVELAVRGNPSFVVSRVDVDRPGPAYSVDMVRLLREERGPEAEFYFIVGLDSLNDILTWHDPQRLISLAMLAVVMRPGYPMPDLARLERSVPGISQRVCFVPMPEIGISSSDLRHRVAIDQPIRYQLPEAVEAYIYRQGLYR